MKILIGLFDGFAQVREAIQLLKDIGISYDDISVVMYNDTAIYGSDRSGFSDNAAISTERTSDGYSVGSVAGVRDDAEMLTMSSFGPFLASGWLVKQFANGDTVSLTESLLLLGVPENDGDLYAERIRQGSSLMVVRVTDDIARQAVDLLDQAGAIDIEAQAISAGSRPQPEALSAMFTDFLEAAVPELSYQPSTAEFATQLAAFTEEWARGNARGADAQEKSIRQWIDAISPAAPVFHSIGRTRPVIGTQAEAVLPVIEENLAVGKREVQSGGVRVYTHVTETPAEANVNLREEHVTVDRRPVNRPVGEADFAAFKEGTIEVTETSEIPVVSKEARVVEEVVVGKEARQRTETVHDIVRRTEVNVEQIAEQNTTTNTTATTVGNTAGHTARDLADNTASAMERTEGSIPGIQTGGWALGGSNTPDTRGIIEKIADTVTGNHIDDKTGRPI